MTGLDPAIATTGRGRSKPNGIAGQARRRRRVSWGEKGTVRLLGWGWGDKSRTVGGPVVGGYRS
jgi:hypothetical protein